MDVTNEVNELAARIDRLPDDAQWELAARVLRRFGWCPSTNPALAAAMHAEIQALLARETINGKAPTAEYRAVG